jgi:hypothetical protein
MLCSSPWWASGLRITTNAAALVSIRARRGTHHLTGRRACLKRCVLCEVSTQLPELREDIANKNRKAIQETTLAKDVLARFQCNTLEEVKAAVGLPFTAIVIGSGMYGAFCAERIYQRGGRVLVLDAGPFVISEHVQNMADPAFDVAEVENLLGQPAIGEFRSPFFFKDDQKRGFDFVKHSYNSGGKSVRWGGWSPRLTKEDLEQWPLEMKQYFEDYYREI